ncbi:MAG: sulfate ABC transporter substrate-binding protein [Planctomycetaceae bacterium]|nr:sulfate ABC transporter substrate-binding protein [Planctomycetaceae bacterium]
MTRRSWSVLVAVVLVTGLSVAGLSGCGSESGASGANGEKRKSLELLNVSYDPTRELWRDINEAFIPAYEKSDGVKLTINQSHAGSATQARAIIDGLEADVATLSIWLDTEALHKKGLLKDGWEDRLPNKSLAYTSTVVFVVRKGNPKGIKDWADLVKGDVSIITPNPKTSGNGKLSLLAAWGNVLKNGGTEDDAKKFLGELYQRVPVLDTGARGATTTFSQKGVGDVHLTMESEAFLEVEESKGELEVVYPALSILHEPNITVVDENVDRKGTRAAAEAYLKFLYTPRGQEIIAKHGFRPTDPEVFAKTGDKFPKITLFPLTDIVPGWDAAQEKFFAEGAIFDSIYHPAK